MNLIVKMIKVYQNSPLRYRTNCRFYPTCSDYTIEAIKEHGTIKGGFMGFKRILRCNPFNKKFGYDTVPKKEKK